MSTVKLNIDYFSLTPSHKSSHGSDIATPKHVNNAYYGFSIEGKVPES